MSSRPDDWSRVREAFEGALAFPADARPAYLSRTCGGDAALRQQVEALLASHERAKSFLETPAAPVATIAVNTMPLEGQRIGTYQLSARIGAGGSTSFTSAMATARTLAKIRSRASTSATTASSEVRKCASHLSASSGVIGIRSWRCFSGRYAERL